MAIMLCNQSKGDVMNITMKSDTYEIHSIELKEGAFMSPYVFANIDVIYELCFNGTMYHLIYQAAQSYFNQNYATPSNQLELSLDAGTPRFLVAIKNIYDSELDSDEWIEENILSEYWEVKTVDEVRAILACLRDNAPNIQNYISLDVDDYEKVFIDSEIQLIEK
jgi:hypothetical protein